MRQAPADRRRQRLTIIRPCAREDDARFSTDRLVVMTSRVRSSSPPRKLQMHKSNPSAHNSFACALLAMSAAVPINACTSQGNDEEAPATSTNALSGPCLPNFAACVAGGGGGGCATKYCFGPCVPEIERCARGKGGAACSDRCGANTASCARKQYISESINTYECGYVYGNPESNSSAAPGKASGVCYRGCGQADQCDIDHEWNGRARCTAGYPLDDSQNPW